MDFIYKIKIIEELQKNYGLTKDKAWGILADSHFDELLEVDKEMVFYYAPSYWAKKLYEQFG